MDVLIDTNIVLDVLLDRDPFAGPARELWARVAAGEVRGHLVATTLTNVFYLARKGLGANAARQAVTDLLVLFEICPVDRPVLEAALVRSMRDFEDAVQDAAAELAGIPIIVTRNQIDFASSTRRIVDAETLVRELSGKSPSP